ncbi:MAG: MotA/TolQ/ExbB proton channel family protein [Endomicrobium sp.]|jgi:biopolymer transport protein ExbB|uniref:MotA/TolQ/ExbB proton channel family protein n=1 Tax=Candidatus Endomicrobiellum cubanum TaxID=3242325 RepID=UPI0028330179|nr:MotA/TolQ/ExbB proton channel family protein [Endomicrobium sp.]
MFEGKSIIEILNMGGVTLYILLGCSVLSVTIICYKIFEFWSKSRVTRVEFIKKLTKYVEDGKLDEALDYCDSVNSPLASVSKAGILAFKVKGETVSENAMEREIMIQTVNLETFTTILATLGSMTVYVGLFGTVLGIISAFHDISAVGAGGIAVIIGGVSEALMATAAGLSVAVPASVAYNFVAKKIDKFVIQMEYCVSALEEVLFKNRSK